MLDEVPPCRRSSWSTGVISSEMVLRGLRGNWFIVDKNSLCIEVGLSSKYCRIQRNVLQKYYSTKKAEDIRQKSTLIKIKRRSKTGNIELLTVPDELQERVAVNKI